MDFQLLHPWIAVTVTLGVFAILQLRRGAAVDLLFLGGLMVVTLTGVISPKMALSGFAEPAVLTIAALLAIAAGLRTSGVLDWVGRKLLGGVDNERGATFRLAVALVASSAFVLNTAVVAMMSPVVIDWCRRRRVSPSRLLIPVSYLTILGGVCTLIGTSTSLVVNARLRSAHEARVAEDTEMARSATISAEALARRQETTAAMQPMGFLEIGSVGLPCALVGAAYMLFVAPRLLPNRGDMLEQLGEQRREYLVEMRVEPNCPFIGQSVEVAGLRHLPGLFLIEIDREGEIITPVGPHQAIHAADRLVFTGVVSTIVDLEKIPGLVPAADISYQFDPESRQKRHLTEVVLSRTSPLIGATVREANFRQLYDAAVVAVHRNGVRLTNKIGNIHLEPGDTLLLQTTNEFVGRFRNHRDFYLVSSVTGAEPRRHDKLPLAASLGLILIAWLAVASFFDPQQAWPISSPPAAAITIVGLMIFFRCMRVSDARNAIDLPMLVTIASALGLGLALQESGAARNIAAMLVGIVGDNPYLLLIIVYVMAMVFTEALTNNAVAALLIPLALEVALESGYSPRPFVMAIALAASLSFVTPIGYQTNLMVMGPGGYRPGDYVRCGLPLALLVAATALLLIPRVWAF